MSALNKEIDMAFKTTILTLSSTLVLLVAAAPAFADGPEHSSKSSFEAGQFALSLNHGFSVNETDLIFGGGEIQGSYFVIPNLSIGIGVGAAYLKATKPEKTQTVAGKDYTTPEVTTSTTVLRLGPRIGYNIELSDSVSLWPQLGIDYRYLSSKSSASGSPDTKDSTSALGVSIYAPIMLHPIPGFFVGAGPSLYTELSNSTTSTTANTTTSGTTSSSSGTTDKTEDNAKITAFGLVATIGGAF
jgi:hypothetical protein